MNRFRLIALDLDGTLLTYDKIITPRTLDALYKAASMGIEIVPCTGRYYKAMPDCVKKLSYLNYAININGASVYDIKAGGSLYQAVMDKALVIRIKEYLDSIPVAYDTYIDNWGYMPKEQYSHIDEYINNPYFIQSVLYYRTPVDDFTGLVENAAGGVQKIQFYSKDPVLVDNAFKELSLMYPSCSVTTSGRDECEITDINATKGRGLMQLAEHLHIDPAEVIAFGDGGNDVSMLKFAGLGIAMGNAKDIAKDAADFITLGNDDDGIAFALERYVF